MSLDDAWRATLRNYSTFFLVVFVVLMPLHLIFGWVFHDVLAVRELHPAIAEFPSTRQVRGVGQADVDRAGLWFWILAAVEVALLPLMAKACRAVLDQEERGEMPTVTAAWPAVRGQPSLSTRPPPATVVGALVVAAVVAVLAEAALGVAADFTPDGLDFAALAVASAVGRSAGLPFLLVALVAGRAERPRPPEKVPDPYR